MNSITSIIYPFAESIAHALDIVSERAEPYQTDGAQFLHEPNEARVKDLRDLIQKPAFVLSDLVSASLSPFALREYQ